VTEVVRIPPSLGLEIPSEIGGCLFWVGDIGPEWEDARAELIVAFEMSREAAKREESIVYVVKNDDLLGRDGPTRAMVSSGLVSAARTAALEGAPKGWTANVIAYDTSIPVGAVLERARFVLSNGITTGEIIHLGPGHIGKALV
jgi:hypothetical protein